MAVFPPMRCVPAPPLSHLPGSLSAEPGAEERAAIEAVRHLGRRFPNARLREVPLVRAAELDGRADPSGSTRVWLALEALQVTGSFQVRGALVAVEAASRTHRRVIAPSVGNHGIAVAYAAFVLGVAATIVVPNHIARTKREKIERYGAELIVASSERYESALAIAKQLAEEQGESAALIVAGQDVGNILGNGSSLGFEIVRGLGGVPERALAPFCDGGLATGLAWALRAELVGEADRGVWGVQSEAHCTMAASLECGRAVTASDAPAPTLAEELREGVSTAAFERAREAIAGVCIVSEAQIAAAMGYAYGDMGLVLEGSAALALAPVLFGLPEGLRGGDMVVVLTGRNIDPDRLDGVLARIRA
ncbi:MAG TPA: pyridoxal-phosphate dependent enzyme [Polyangiaceae bacterium]|jgi:threonine dehydratase|nr:pyridoxal-phosphate dependent enzyme [Polyangiaceae bacterium]